MDNSVVMEVEEGVEGLMVMEKIQLKKRTEWNKLFKVLKRIKP